MLIRLDRFGGIVPKLSPRLISGVNAQVADNCKFVSGALRPWKTTLAVNTPAKVGTKKSIFKVVDGGTGYWFHWVNQDVNAILSPIANDTWKRIYWTGDGVPKMAPLSVAVTGGTNYPVASYNLGLPAPLAPPAPAVTGTVTNPDPTLIEYRAYVYTYVSAYGEEGPPCAASLTVTVAPGQTVNLSGMSAVPAGAYNVVTKRIYRTNTGASGTSYQRVAEIPAADSTYSDAVASADLGAVLPSLEWSPPPDDLKGLIVLPNGACAGFSGNVLCLSEPYFPHAWPVGYQITVADLIVSIGSFGNSIVVTTTGAPYVATGDPGAMSVERLEMGYACTSKRGTVDMGYAVIYPTPEGLMQAGVNGVNLVSREHYGKDEWAALAPSSIEAYPYAGKYIAFHTGGAFVYDPATSDLSRLTGVTATAGFHDPANGDLYLQVGSDIVKWDAGVGTMTYTWKSKIFVAPSPLSLGACQVFADAYPVTLKVYADGVLKHTQTVSNANPFRLPAGFRATTWEAEVSSVNTVNEILLASTMAELGQA